MSDDLHKDLSAKIMTDMTVNQRERVANDLCANWKADYEKQPLLPDLGQKEGERREFRVPQVNPVVLRKLATNQELLTNDDWTMFFEGVYSMRVTWLQALIDPRRNMDAECGYPPVIIPKQYRYMFDRNGVATRVNNIYPDECWAVDPKIYENVEIDDTEFENAWKDFSITGIADKEAWFGATTCSPLHYLHRADCLSGIGRFGTLLIGLDDGEDLSIPAKGLDDRGQPDATAGKTKHKILFMRPFDELMCHVINFERDPTNPRFGQPVFYHILFADIRVGEPGMTAASISLTSRVVHWTRLIHIADNRESSEVFGVPRMQDVFNYLCDVRKILGGSAEMFWKGGFPGYSFELMPEILTGGVTIDQESVKKQFEAYANGLSRYLSIVGLNAKSLAPQVADPTGNLLAQLQAIAMAKGIPLRIFMGSEQAQLASGQDVRTWNRRIMKRQERYITPLVIRPFINRCIVFGVLPRPKEPFKVLWPDINIPSEDEKSQIADRYSAALMKYVMGGGYQVIPPINFLTMIMNLKPDQVLEIQKNAGGKWDNIEPPNKGGADGKAQGNTTGEDT